MPRYRFVILAVVCGLAFMGNYMQYQVSALALRIMPIMGIDTVGFSALFLAPMLAAVFFGVPLGVLGDRIGPKRVVSAMFCMSIAGGALRVVTQEYFAFQLVSMFLIGMGMAALSTNVVKVISLWFGKTTVKGIGIYYAVSCLGIVVAQATGALFPSTTVAYAAAEVVLVACVACWMLFDRNLPDGVAPLSQDEGALMAFAVAARNRNVWLIALAVGFSLAATTAYAGFLPQALEAGKGIDSALAGSMAALVTVASIFGCVAGPALCGRFCGLKTYLVVVNLIAAVAMFYTWYAAEGAVLWTVLFLNGFLTSMTGPILQSVPVMLKGIGSRYAGSAGGVIGTVSLLMSYVLPVGISYIAGADYALNMGIESFSFCLSVIPVALLPRLNGKES